MLSSPGIGSGLDVQGIVSQLIQLEQRPIVQLSEREVELKAALSGFGKLSSAVAEFQSSMQALSDADKFRIFAAESSNEDVLTATASSSAGQGVFEVDVQRLAENHRKVSGTAFADTGTTTIGSAGDTMTIQVGGGIFEVEIGDLTLEEIRTAINDAGGNTGVTASIITDDAGSYLTLTADETGSDNFITVSYSGTDPFSFSDLNADRDGDSTFTAADLNAVVVLEDQFTITRNRNTIGDAVSGLTLDLAATGQSTVSVGRDIDAVKSNVRDFVEAFNTVISTIDELAGGVLASDRSTLLSLESQFRGVLAGEVESGGAFTRLFEIGISTRRDGTLTIDDEILNGVLGESFDDVATLFAEESSGYAVRFDGLAEAFLGADGVFSAREDSIGNQISLVEDRKITLQQRLADREERLLLQFSQLDGLLTSLNATSDFLTQQLDSLAELSNFDR